MPRIRLAHWHEGHAPGDEIDVDQDTLHGLVFDGRIAEVLPETYAEGGTVPPAQAADVNSTSEAEPVLTADQWAEVQAAAEAPKRRRKLEE